MHEIGGCPGEVLICRVNFFQARNLYFSTSIVQFNFRYTRSFSKNSTNFVFSPDHGLLWCRVPKAGSTTWSYNYMKLLHRKKPGKKEKKKGKRGGGEVKSSEDLYIER